jgi:hypothetical protein
MCACSNKAIRIGSYGSSYIPCTKYMHASIHPVKNACMETSTYVATRSGRYRGIYNVYMADVYEGMHIGSFMRQVFTQPIK